MRVLAALVSFSCFASCSGGGGGGGGDGGGGGGGVLLAVLFSLFQLVHS